MSEQLTYEQVLDLLPAYASGALDPEEQKAIEEYLSKHRALLDRLDRMSGPVAYPAEPAAAEAASAGPGSARPDHNAGGETNILELRRRRREEAARADLPQQETADSSSRRSFVPWLWGSAAAIGALALIAFGLFTVLLGDRLAALQDQLRTTQETVRILQIEKEALQANLSAGNEQIATLQSELDRRLNQLETLQATVDDRSAQVEELNQQVGALQQQIETERTQLAFFTEADRIILVAGTEEGPGIRGAFYVRESQGILSVRGLPPLAPEQTYQLWLISADGASIPADLLGEGGDSLQVQVDVSNVQPFTTVSISVEPASGSETPTGPIVALGQTGNT